VNPNPFKNINIQWRTGGLRSYLVVLALILVLGGLLPQWFLNTISTLLVLAIAAPIVGFLGLRWWLSRNLVQGTCPVCQYPLTSVKTAQVQCPSCSERLTVVDGAFKRSSPPGTIDVDVVEISQD
jgi:hypothetical protein